VGKEEKIAELRHALTMLDQDHDALRAEADGKDERIAQLRQQLSQQVRGRGREGMGRGGTGAGKKLTLLGVESKNSNRCAIFMN